MEMRKANGNDRREKKVKRIAMRSERVAISRQSSLSYSLFSPIIFFKPTKKERKEVGATQRKLQVPCLSVCPFV